MLVWINGTFGVGKTTAARRFVKDHPGTRLFDPEWIGELLVSHLRDRPIDDFQNLVAWRRLVPLVARELAEFTGDGLVAAQTVLREPYWHELRAGLTGAGFDVRHIVLDAAPAVVRARIDGDTHEIEAAGWRHEHVERYLTARTWLRGAADVWVDTSALDPDGVSGAISEAIRRSQPGRRRS